MTKKSFYLTLNIMNILFCLYMYAMLYSYLFLTLDNWRFGFSVFFSVILMRFFIFYLLIKLIKKYFPNFVLSKITDELKTNNLAKEKSLVLAFAYDVVIMILFVVFFSVTEHLDGWNNHSKFFNFYYALGYEIFTIDGVLMFYLSTFCLWKIEDKIKDFYNKKRLNNKSAK